jgi:HEXXH motif-containing protein
LITTHSLSASAFSELAGGAGDSVVVRELREAQLSKHLMLLHVVAGAAAGVDRPSPEADAFDAGYRLLAQVQAAHPAVVARVLGLPHVGSWTHECLACLDSGSPPDFGYLAAVAAAAAIPTGLEFTIDVPVRDGRVPLPGLGCLQVADEGDAEDADEGTAEGERIRLSSDGIRLRAGRHIELACAALTTDDGSGLTTPHWQGTPLVRAEADGRTWDVLLEIADQYLDRYALPMLTAPPAVEVAAWRRRLQSAWELLVRHHERAAGPVAEGVSVIVPLAPRSDLDSATSPAAFGAIASSLPPSAVSMAETLIHEFQHTKLCGLMDMLPLIEPTGERGYAPWREDPRPLEGLLQGVYAFAGIVDFWDVQRHVETEPDDVLRANVLYERWRSTIELVTGTLLGPGLLTPDGARFVTALREREQRRESRPTPADAVEIAREVSLDNWLTWQLRHTAVDPAGVAALAAAFQRGLPGPGRAPAEAIDADTRKVDSVARSRLLNQRFQEPQRYRQLSAAGLPELGPADALLVRGDASAALAAYREELAAEPDPAAWIGLALAVHRLPAGPSRSVLARRLPVLFEVHACLAAQGVRADPLDLAAWLA